MASHNQPRLIYEQHTEYSLPVKLRHLVLDTSSLNLPELLLPKKDQDYCPGN